MKKFFVYKCKLSVSLALLNLVDLFINKLKTKFHNLFYRMILNTKRIFNSFLKKLPRKSWIFTSPLRGLGKLPLLATSTSVNNCYLARTKSEALDNIYILFKQNIKSCNAKRRRQRRRTVKNNNRSN